MTSFFYKEKKKTSKAHFLRSPTKSEKGLDFYVCISPSVNLEAFLVEFF